MSYMPCENPNCNSYGKPHPNCKCYGEMAEGGEASFCSKERAHAKDCQFFASGGEAIDQDSVVPDPAPASGSTEIDPSSVVVDGQDNPQSEGSEIDPSTVVPDENQENDQADVPAGGETESTKYETPKQQAIGAVEGLAHGLTLGASDIAEEKLLDVPAEDIAGRASDNPWGHGATEMIGTALGPGKIIKGAKIGSALVKQAIESGIVSAGDEVSKWALGQGDPNDGAGAALVHVALSTVLGGLLGKAGSIGQKSTEKTLNAIAEKKFGEQGHFFLYGIANAMKPSSPIEKAAEKEAVEGFARNSGLSKAAVKGYDAGQKFFNSATTKLLPPTLGAVGEGIVGAKEGYDKDGLMGGVMGAGEGAAKGALYGLTATLAGMGIRSASSKYAAPALLKVLSGSSMIGNAIPGVTGALDHVADMAAGFNATKKVVQGVFNTGARTAERSIEAYGDPKIRAKIDKYLEDNEHIKELQNQDPEDAPADTPQYAKGGDVMVQPQPGLTGDHGAATHYPEQNMIMKAAKGRMINYLNTLRPTKIHSKLAYDEDPDTTVQKKRYEKALDLAATPLGIMKEVKDGTLDPETMSHFKALHPEVEGLLNKQITEHIVKGQMKGEKPPFHVRQSLSLFMGNALSSDFTPETIQAAQATFSSGKPKPDGGGQAPKTKRGTAPLSKSDSSFLTDDQARERRQQKV